MSAGRITRRLVLSATRKEALERRGADAGLTELACGNKKGCPMKYEIINETFRPTNLTNEPDEYLAKREELRLAESNSCSTARKLRPSAEPCLRPQPHRWQLDDFPCELFDVAGS